MAAVGEVASSWVVPPLAECGDDAPGCVLVDMRCYIADLPNATTATGVTGSGLPIQVTFRAARPPALSHLYVHCPGKDFPASAPKVVAAHADLLLLRVPIYPDSLSCVKARFWDYFVYRAQPARLDRIPNTHPKIFNDPEAALISLKDGGFVVASLRHRFPRRDVSSGAYITEFDLHLYRSSSPDDGWVTTRLSVEDPVRDPLPRAVADLLPYHETSKTVTVGGERGTVAWVDLWRGVILCDVLDDRLVLRDVPLPPLARGNWDRLLQDGIPRIVRDVTISRHKDSIKCVEMERSPPKEPEKTTRESYLDWVHGNRRDPIVRGDGWKVTTWSLPIPVGSSCEDWRRDHDLHVNDLTVDASKQCLFNTRPNLQGCDIKPLMRRLPVAYPTLSMDGDAVYLLSNVDEVDVMVAVDVKNKTLEEVADLDTQKNYFLMPSYCSTEISSYLNKTTGLLKELPKPTEKDLPQPAKVHSKELTSKTGHGRKQLWVLRPLHDAIQY